MTITIIFSIYIYITYIYNVNIRLCLNTNYCSFKIKQASFVTPFNTTNLTKTRLWQAMGVEKVQFFEVRKMLDELNVIEAIVSMTCNIV